MSDNVDTTTTKKTTVRSTVVAKAAPVPVTVIYIGPSIPGVVTTNTIFNNGISTELETLKGKLPAIKELIVPVDKLVAARAKLRDRKSATSICYEKALLYTEKGE